MALSAESATGGDLVARTTFYITTPIYYPSDDLHVGHAYTTVAADALARFHRLRGEEVFFLTGTDEHGQKIERRAAAAGLAPAPFVEGIVAGIRLLWEQLGISHDGFLRTTEERHARAVQEVFRTLRDRGDIYKASYEGWYCTPCEAFWLPSKLVDGNCPDCGRPVERLREESYFFRLSRYQKRLLAHLEEHPDFVQPPSRRNEMLNFVRQGLEDLSISRTSFSWGIPVPDEPDHVIYVWFDALLNYLSGIGYPDEGFRHWWPAQLHLVGKEIVRFHAVIWPCILMALDLPLPERVYGHGWLLMGDTKMSKSRGNTVDPRQLIQRYGRDALRYFLLREVPFGSDGAYSEEALVRRTNVDLANDLGNLLSRTTAMIERFAGGVIPPGGADPGGLARLSEEVTGEVTRALEGLELSGALTAVWRLVARANKLIEERSPWALAKAGDPALDPLLYSLAETLRVTAVLLAPFLMDTPGRILEQLGSPAAPAWADAAWGGLVPGTRIRRGAPLFPRLVPDPAGPQHPAAVPAAPPEEVSLEEFQRLDLRIATVREASQVAGADRLLRLSLALDGEVRTVVAGIAAAYRPEDLVGRQVLFLANLRPARIRGVTSQGMILAASGSDGPRLLSPDRDVPDGTRVR
ncbi:MAG: methionine--tRNA ligase [Thermaerobacter sp.]|nr:methionine--tRNA ligase [Thermaerobacter sp.]